MLILNNSCLNESEHFPSFFSFVTELTPSTENAEVFSPQELVPTEENRSIPFINVQEVIICY